MFDALTRQPDDPLLALIGLFRADERAGKVDLGVGVYRDETGATPIFRAVKEAEKRLVETQPTKAYVGPEGDPVFLERLWDLTTGEAGRGRATPPPAGPPHGSCPPASAPSSRRWSAPRSTVRAPAPRHA